MRVTFIKGMIFLGYMKEIPNSKAQIYSEQYRNLRTGRNQLRSASEIQEAGYDSLSRLEGKLATEAFVNIAFRQIEVDVTLDPSIYRVESTRINSDNTNRLLLLCDENGDLQDLQPLLQYVSKETRGSYRELKDKYLSGQ